MGREQELEWNAAQQIEISVDLVATAKQQLKFLAAVDRKRLLYEGPCLERAIYRYNACWLPLLAKHSESPMLEGCLVVPLDCEWVWHCHRLNPVRYKSDCEELFGRILDKHNVASTVQGSLEKETEEIWNRFYPNEPYNWDPIQTYSDNASEKVYIAETHTKYDLVSAVKRQEPFCYQVSRPHMNHEPFLEGAVTRYKGFLHVIRRNREKSLKCFCVPTYDIDLIWHSHQLHPSSYCKDLLKILGKVLEHDDMDSDRNKGKKLDVGFSQTTKQWEDTFGTRYWRAGAMYRGIAPSPLTTTPFLSDKTKVIASNGQQKILPLSAMKAVEVMLEFVEVRNLPEEHKRNLVVCFSKTQPDTIFNSKRRLSILSEAGEKHVACFQCEPKGHLHFELVSYSSSYLPKVKLSKTMGSTSLCLEEFLCPVSSLAVEKWLELVPFSGIVNSKPIELRVAISFTIPIPAPHVLRMDPSRSSYKHSCVFPLLRQVQFARNWTCVIDEAGNEVISFQMRNSKKVPGGHKSITRKEVIGITNSGETCTLAEFVGDGWSLVQSQCPFQIQRAKNNDGYLFELIGNHNVKIFPGRKLEYEPKHSEKQRSEYDCLTAVDFSVEYPYGRAVALLDLKLRVLKVKEEWFFLTGATLAFILSDILRKEGYNGLILWRK